MTTFTKPMVNDIAAKLRKFLESEGYTVGKINSRWSPCENKLSISLKGDEDGADQEAQDYKRYQKRGYISLPDALGKQIQLNGRPMTVTGYFVSRPKNSIRLVDAEGRIFLTTTKTLQAVWARQEGK